MAKLAVDPFTDFLNEGPLDPSAVVEVFREQPALARASGYEGVRLVADMDWLLPAEPMPDVLVTYETVLDRVTAELDATMICAYRRLSFAPAALGGALAVHSTLRGQDTEPQFRFIFDGAGGWRLSGEIDVAVSFAVRGCPLRGGELRQLHRRLS